MFKIVDDRQYNTRHPPLKDYSPRRNFQLRRGQKCATQNAAKSVERIYCLGHFSSNLRREADLQTPNIDFLKRKASGSDSFLFEYR